VNETEGEETDQGDFHAWEDAFIKNAGRQATVSACYCGVINSADGEGERMVLCRDERHDVKLTNAEEHRAALAGCELLK
jgi:hypothetical protein